MVNHNQENGSPELYAQSQHKIKIKQIKIKSKEIKGPKTSAPDQALMGFLRSNKIEKKDLFKKKTEKDEFYFYKTKATSLKTHDLLTEFIPKILSNYQWKKSMKWGEFDLNWGRPLKSILSIFDKKIVSFVKGQDLPTGGVIIEPEDSVYQTYKSGKGSFRVRSKWNLEKVKNGKWQIIISEIPYQVDKSRLVEKIAELSKEKRIEGISEIRDESNKDGVRIVIEIRSGQSPEVILNNLYALTPLENVYGINNVALINNVPKLLNLKQILEVFIDHRKEVVTRRTKLENRRSQILENIEMAVFIWVSI